MNHNLLKEPVNVQLTDELLAKYSGGQVEIRKLDEGIFYRGAIACIWVNEFLNAATTWLAKSTGPYAAWENCSYAVSGFNINLELCNAQEMTTDGGEMRLRVDIPSINIVLVLFPPGSKKLVDTKNVRGLTETMAQLPLHRCIVGAIEEVDPASLKFLGEKLISMPIDAGFGMIAFAWKKKLDALNLTDSMGVIESLLVKMRQRQQASAEAKSWH